MLEEKRIVIIGGRSAIGEALAREAVRQGAWVVVTSRTRWRLLANGNRENRDERVLDIGNEESVAGFFAGCGEIDHVICLAGVPSRPSPLEVTESEFLDSHYRVKLRGQFLVLKHAPSALAEGGSIVLASGFPAHRAAPEYAVHAALSAAAESLVRTAAVELSPIRVNAVSPAFVESERGFFELSGEAQAARLQGGGDFGVPGARMATPEDVAHTCLFAMTNPHFTGQILTVDGGLSIR